MPTTTPLMSLQTPNPGETNYPTSISTSFSNIDGHTHESGSGAQIPTGGLEDDAVTTAKIDDLAVTAAKLAADSVTTAKILNANVTTAKIADGAVTAAKHAALGQQISSSSGTFQTQSLTPVDVTNLSVTITTSGRPVFIGLQEGSIGSSKVTGTAALFVTFNLVRDASTIDSFPFILTQAATSVIYQIPSSVVRFIDAVAAGTYTYKIQAFSDDGVAFADIRNAKLIAYEIS